MGAIMRNEETLMAFEVATWSPG